VEPSLKLPGRCSPARHRALAVLAVRFPVPHPTPVNTPMRLLRIGEFRSPRSAACADRKSSH